MSHNYFRVPFRPWDTEITIQKKSFNASASVVLNVRHNPNEPIINLSSQFFTKRPGKMRGVLYVINTSMYHVVFAAYISGCIFSNRADIKFGLFLLRRCLVPSMLTYFRIWGATQVRDYQIQ